MRRLLAALASFMFVTAVVAVAAPPRAAALDGVPRIVVHPDGDSVVAEGMAPGAAITITRGDPPAVIAEGLLEMTDEGDVRFQCPEDIHGHGHHHGWPGRILHGHHPKEGRQPVVHVHLPAALDSAAGWAPSHGTADHRVTRAATSTSILNASALAAKPTRVGEAYAVIVKVVVVAPGSGTPVGPVTVSDGSATCTIVALSAVGTGSCQLTSTSAGTRTVTARYDGTPDFGASQAAAVHRVTRR